MADLLGELFAGIYHLDKKELPKVDWENTHHIVVKTGERAMSTFDNSELTRLVLLAHHYCLRAEISGTKGGLILMFHRRERDGEISRRHPTIDQAVETFKKYAASPEYGVSA